MKKILTLIAISGTLATTAEMPRFAVSLARTSDGIVWAGTDGDGLWKSDDCGKTWQRDKTYDEVGGDCSFCLCVDSSGRLWSGSLEKGVCVYNGSEWHSYCLENGFIGSRVFAIAEDQRGNVWIASDGGLANYDEKSDNWRFFSRVNGLAENEIQAIVCDDKTGDVLLGYATHGLSIGKRSNHYNQWKVLDKGGECSRVNCMYQHESEMIFIGMDSGVAVAKKVSGSWRISYIPISTRSHLKKNVSSKLSWDRYVTAICRCSKDAVLIAFRSGLLSIYDVRTNKIRNVGDANEGREYPLALLHMRDDVSLVAFYGFGVELKYMMSCKEDGSFMTFCTSSKQKTLPAEPCSRNAMQSSNKLPAGLRTKRGEPSVFYLRDDWETKGNWWGRYGKRLAVLCAAHGQYGDCIIYGGDPDRYKVIGQIGACNKNSDGLRRWVHWVETDNLNSLWLNSAGVRRQAEWDDHGEAYPINVNGPDLMVRIFVPPGMHDIAFYFFNKDCRHGKNVCRDYLIEATLYDKNKSVLSKKGGHEYPVIGKNDEIFARARVRDFYQGVYKVFRVRGGEEYLFSIKRQGSHNVILSGVFISGAREQREKQESPFASTSLQMGGVVYQSPEFDATSPDGVVYGENERRLDSAKSCIGYDLARTDLCRMYAKVSQGSDQNLAEVMRWKLLRWATSDRDSFSRYMMLGWIGAIMKNPWMKSHRNSPYGKNTLDDELCASKDTFGYSLTNWFNKVSAHRRMYMAEPKPGFWKKCAFAPCVSRSPVANVTDGRSCSQKKEE